MDYDGDGHLDLFIANYIDLDLKTVSLPESGPCLYKGVLVACGPPGLPGGKNLLYHNNCNGTFTDVSERAGLTRFSRIAGDFGWRSAPSKAPSRGALSLSRRRRRRMIPRNGKVEIGYSGQQQP